MNHAINKGHLSVNELEEKNHYYLLNYSDHKWSSHNWETAHQRKEANHQWNKNKSHPIPSAWKDHSSLALFQNKTAKAEYRTGLRHKARPIASKPTPGRHSQLHIPSGTLSARDAPSRHPHVPNRNCNYSQWHSNPDNGWKSHFPNSQNESNPPKHYLYRQKDQALPNLLSIPLKALLFQPRLEPCPIYPT